ncbi:MAG TPA: hypothetical protein VFN13_02760 [Rudaea sp.]|nr:hypothetical protein [Rudaea sp.]
MTRSAGRGNRHNVAYIFLFSLSAQNQKLDDQPVGCCEALADRRYVVQQATA